MTTLERCFFCLAPAVEICAQCGLVGFCGEPDHKKIHKPDDMCFPFHVESRLDIGNVMVASRDIQPAGTLT